MLQKTLSILLLFVFTFEGRAQLNEQFNFPINTNLAGQNWMEHSGNGSNPITMVEGLSFFNLNESTAAARLNGAGQDVYQSFQGISTGSVYVRFLLSVENASAEGDYFFHLGPMNLGTDFRARVFTKNESGKLKFGVSKSSNNAQYGTQDFEFNKVYLLVLKYTFNNTSNTDDIVELAVLSDLAELKEEIFLLTAASGESDASNLGSVALRQGNAALAPSLIIDEIKVSDSWREVTRLETPPSIELIFPKELYAFDRNCREQSVFKVDFVANKKGESLNIWSLDAKNISFSKDRENWTNQLNFSSASGNYMESIFVRFEGVLLDEKKEIVVLVDDFEANLELERRITFGQIQLSSDCSMEIAQAKKMPLGETVRISGVISASAKEFGTFNYIQDGSAGLRINGKYNWAMGDSVSFLGQIGMLNEEVIMLKDTCCDLFEPIQKRGTGNIKVYETNIENIAQLEGSLVRIKNAQLNDKNFVFLPNSNERIRDETGSLETRIWSATTIDGFAKPQNTGIWQGVVGRFRDRIQLYPREIEDIEGAETYNFPALKLPTDDTFDLAAWNVEWFGSSGNGPEDDQKQLENVKNTLEDLDADAFILTEVSSLTYFDDLLKALPNYGGTCSPAVSGGFSEAEAQRICLVYKKDIITLSEIRPLLRGTPVIANYPESFDRFWASGRLPALFVCDVELNNVKKRLHIIGIHARANRNNAEERELVYQMRKKDLEVLKDSLDLHFSLANIIMAGDFNDDLDESVVAGIAASSYKPFVDDKQNWNMISKALSDKGYKSFIGFDNVIDHFGISNELQESYVPNSVFLAMPFIGIEDYPNTTSDHLPIMARFSFEADEIITSNDLLEVDSILVYPNPSNGVLNLLTAQETKFATQLFDQKGLLLLETKGNKEQIEKKISRQLRKAGQGLYLLKLIIGNEVKTYKIVNQ